MWLYWENEWYGENDYYKVLYFETKNYLYTLFRKKNK